MPIVAAFIADPVDFMKRNVVFPGGMVPGRSVCQATGVYDVTFHLNQTTNAYKKKAKGGNEIPYYNLVRANAGESSFRIYWLGYESNSAHGMALGNGVNDPQYMFTVRMNSCTLGYAQANRRNPAYVSHHNAQSDGNTHAAMEGKAIQWDDGSRANTNMKFAHREQYMKSVTDGMYGATTFGVRDANGIWHFYFQKSKGHNFKHKDLSLKGVAKVN